MELADNFLTTGSIPGDSGSQGPRLFNNNSGGFCCSLKAGGRDSRVSHAFV